MDRKSFFNQVVMLCFVAFFPIALTSCGGDDDNESSAIESDVVGSWRQKTTSGWWGSGEDGGYVRFQKNGKFIEVSFDEDYDDVIYVQEGTWTTSHESINITYQTGPLNGTTLVYDIIEKSKNKLKISCLGITGFLERVADSEMDAYINEANKAESQTLTVNGITWEASKYNQPVFYAYYIDNGKDIKDLSCKFSKQMDSLYPDEIRITITSVNYLNAIPTNVNLGNSSAIGSIELTYTHGVPFFSDDYIYGSYTCYPSNKPSGATGSVTITNITEDGRLTIKFNSFKVGIDEDGDAGGPKSLTLDGTVTFRETDDYLLL